MLHSVGTQLGGQFYDLEKEMDETRRKQEILAQLLSKHVKRDVDTIKLDIQRNFYQTSEEALDYGIIDNIIIQKDVK